MFSWEKDRKAAAYYLLLCIASKEHRFEGSQEAREEAMIHFSQCKQYAEGNAETLIMVLECVTLSLLCGSNLPAGLDIGCNSVLECSSASVSFHVWIAA